MKMFFSRMIILLFFVLQGFTPLVHAHVEPDTEGSVFGIHIDSLSRFVIKDKAFSSQGTRTYHSAVISMCPAIQKNKGLSKKLPSRHFADNKIFSISINSQFNQFCSFSQGSHSQSSIELLIQSPRAPPFLL